MDHLFVPQGLSAWGHKGTKPWSAHLVLALTQSPKAPTHCIHVYTHSPCVPVCTHTPCVHIYTRVHTCHVSVCACAHCAYMYTHTRRVSMWACTHRVCMWHTCRVSMCAHTHRLYTYIHTYTLAVCPYVHTHRGGLDVYFLDLRVEVRRAQRESPSHLSLALLGMSLWWSEPLNVVHKHRVNKTVLIFMLVFSDRSTRNRVITASSWGIPTCSSA